MRDTNNKNTEDEKALKEVGTTVTGDGQKIDMN